MNNEDLLLVPDKMLAIASQLHDIRKALHEVILDRDAFRGAIGNIDAVITYACQTTFKAQERYRDAQVPANVG